MNDPFDLHRFVAAQESTYERALAELRLGEKVGHWMWFVFPQLEGLGRSPQSKRYAIRSADEARAYLAHPLLGPRLLEATRAVLVVNASAREILGTPDDLKLRSCATLFASVLPNSVFDEVLAKFFRSEPDEFTVSRLGHSNP